MSYTSIASTLILTLLFASTPVASAQTLTGRLVSVGDGNTLQVATSDKTVLESR